ncbi:MAG: three-Cys-motif partner protein TcmP [archaeon]
MAEKLEGMDWLKKQIKQLEVSNSKFKDTIEELKVIHPGVYNEFGYWTPLKLILLHYVFDVCSMIINKQPFFKKMYYVDLFAGAGINKIRETSDFLIGSPLITELTHGDKYDKMFFCENDDKSFLALKARMDYLRKDNLDCLYGDCNIILDKILKTLNEERNTYSFFFIDPYTMEFSWDSMKKVLGLRSDIVFTLMNREIIRNIGYANRTKSKSMINELNRFFGDDSWKKIETCDEINDLYINNIKRERKDAIVLTVKIMSSKYGFSYDVIFITNKTKGDCPWIKAIETAKKEIENHSDEAVELAMDIIKQRQQTLA